MSSAIVNGCGAGFSIVISLIDSTLAFASESLFLMLRTTVISVTGLSVIQRAGIGSPLCCQKYTVKVYSVTAL